MFLIRRELSPPASLETTGYELRAWPTACTDFGNDEAVVGAYYGEMIELVKQVTPAPFRPTHTAPCREFG